MKQNFVLLITVILLLKFEVQAQHKKDKKISVLPVPAIGYSPETKTYIGVVTLFTIKNLNDSLTRSSNAKIEFNYTWNKQLVLETGWNYFLPEEQWFTRGLMHFSKYPDLYYGIGFDTPESGEISFQSNRIIFDVDLFRNLKDDLFLGLGFNYSSYNNLEYLSDFVFYPELKEQDNFGLKLIFLKDSRNNILSPSKGNYFEFNNSFNFSASFYVKSTVDYRHYLGFGENKQHVVAGRFFHSGIWGNPPFYDYSKIGGDKYVRGYFLGRFREKNLSSIQLELRNHLFWRIGIATFGGLSLMYEKISMMENESFKPNFGLGLRFLVDKKENTNLRIDYALGADNQSGFYISFGESF